MRLAKKREFVVGVTAGSGAVAAISSHSGADFLLAFNAARLRNMGAPSIACMLPLYDARAAVNAYADIEVLPQVNIPVLVGTHCWRDNFDAAEEAKDLLARGFSGVVNFPPCSLYPDSVQRRLEVAGVGFSAELAMLSAAQKTGAIALAYCRTISQGRQAALAGIDNILLNFGWNTGGRLSPSSENTLEEAAAIAASFSKQIRRIRPDACLLLEGGPVETEDDLATVLEHADLDGYIGGSTFERLPIERSVADRIASFKLASKRFRDIPPSDQQVIAFGERAGFTGTSRALVAALSDLRDAWLAKSSLACVVVPEGDSFQPAIDALTRQARTGSIVQGVDLTAPTQLPPDTAEAQLFGDRATRAYVGASDVDFIVLRNPEALPTAVQLRLAEHIAADRTGNTPSGQRFIFVTHSALGSDNAHFAPGFASLLKSSAVMLPGLQARAEDITDLLNSAMGNMASREARAFSPAALLRLQNYDWPGNTAELYALCTRLAKNNPRKLVSVDEVETLLRQAGETSNTQATGSERRQIVVDALKRNGFRKGRTAQALGISRKTLYNWMKREGLN